MPTHEPKRPTAVKRRRPTLDRKQPPASQQSRRERRAAANRDRFDAARDERRSRAVTRGGGGGSSGRSSIGIMTIGGLVIGVAIVAVLALNQLGGRGGDDLIEPTGTYPQAIVDGAALGSLDAPVVMEVFEDFQCSVCARHSLTVEPVLVARYVNNGTLRIVHRDLAFLGNGTAGDESVLAANAASCALDQDGYFDMALWMYENQDGVNRGGFRRERLDQMAERAGLDMSAYATCMDDPATRADVETKTREIMGQGVNSTPTVRINGGELIVGLQAADALGAAIEAAAAAATPTP